MSKATPLQPRDKNAAPIPVLAPAVNTSDTLDSSAQHLALPVDADGNVYPVVEVASLGNCYILFGSSSDSPTSASQLFVAGVAQYKVPQDATYLNHLQQSGTDNGAVITVTGLV